MADGNTEQIVLEITGDGQGAITMLNDLLGALRDLSGALNDFQGKTTSAGSGAKSLAGHTKKANVQAKEGGNLFQQLGGLIAGLNPASLAAAAGLLGVYRALVSLGREIMTVVDAAQTLTINLESLAGRELVKGGEFETVAEAMDTASEAAKGMLAQLEAIGLKSPYANEMVNQTFRTAMAYGWASNQAMDLTEAMLDLSAAMGKSGWEMSRISINLGQIRSKGRIAGQELRDLNGLGVNLADILQSQLGVSVEQFNSQLKTGQMTMDDFAQAMSDYVTKNFAGAAQRLAGTIQGLKASFQDLRQISLRKIFKPGIDVVTKELADAFGGISEWVQKSGALDAIGAKLAAGVTKAVAAIKKLGALIGPVFDKLKTFFAGLGFFDGLPGKLGFVAWQIRDLADKVWQLLGPAFVWVGKIIASLPWERMFTNFRDVVNGVLDFINKMLMGIRALLAGDSDAAVKPFHDAFVTVLTLIAFTLDSFVSDMLTWGWNLVVQLANGIISAAKTVLKQAMTFLGNIIGLFLKPGSPPKMGPLSHIVEWGRGVMQTFVNAFKLADFGVLKEVLSPIQSALQDAFSAGNLTEVEYLEQFKTVRTQVTQLISDFRQTGEINKGMLDAISGSLGEGGRELVKYLELQLQRQKAIEHLAKVQEKVAEAEKGGFVSQDLLDELAAAEAAASAVEEQVNWQKELIDLQRESVDIQLRLIAALEKLADTGKEKEPKGGGADSPMEQPDFTSGIGEFLGGVKQEFEGFGELGELFGTFSDRWLLWNQRVETFLAMPLGDQVGLLVQKLGEVTGIDFQGYWQKITDFFGQTVLPIFTDVWTFLSTQFNKAVEWLGTFINETLLPAWQIFIGFLETGAWPLLKSVAGFLKSAFLLALRLVSGSLHNWWYVLSVLLGPAIEVVKGLLKKVGDYLTDKLNKAVTDIKDAWEEFKDLIDGPLKKVFTWFNEHVLEVMDEGLLNIYNSVKWVIAVLDSLKARFDNIRVPDWAKGHSPPPLANWFSYIADSVAATNAQLAATEGLFSGRLSQARYAMAGAGLGGINVQVAGGMNFPNVRDGRDAGSVRRELQRYADEAAAMGRIRGNAG